MTYKGMTASEYAREYYQSLSPEEREARIAKQKATYYKNRAAELGISVEEYLAIKAQTKRRQPRNIKRDITKKTETEIASAEAEATVDALIKAEAEETVVDTTSEHSLVSPSSVERVCSCPASVVLTKDLPNVETEFAKEGTEFHAKMEYLLTHPLANEMELMEFIHSIPDVEMAEHVRVAYNYISKIISHINPYQIDVELKLPVFYSDKDKGTLDFGMVQILDNCHFNVIVLDWKYGKGHYVEVEKNKQILSYAMSYLNYLSTKFDSFIVDKVTTIIYQPRCLSKEGKTARAYTYTMPELKALCNEIEDRVEVAYHLLSAPQSEVEANTCAGEHCLFCKLRQTCRKHYELINKDALLLLEDIKEEKNVENFKNISLLSDEEMIKIIEFGETKLPKLKSYIEDVMKLLQNRLESGEKIPGLKLVEGRGRRKWIDDEEHIINTLESAGVDCTKTVLKTLTEVESILKTIDRKDLLSSLVTMSEGKVRVALESDKRKTVDTTLISDL